MPVRGSLVRATALVAVAALALHELRYLIGYGAGSQEALASQQHSYLPAAVVACGALVAVAAGQLAVRLVRGDGDERAPGLATAWAWASVALLAIYVAQESAEAVVSHGHPDGLAAVAGHGGLVAVPLAVALGGLVAVGLRAARHAVAAAARRPRPIPPRRRPGSRRPRPRFVPPSAGVLALNLAGRAPPARS